MTLATFTFTLGNELARIALYALLLCLCAHHLARRPDPAVRERVLWWTVVSVLGTVTYTLLAADAPRQFRDLTSTLMVVGVVLIGIGQVQGRRS